MLAWARGQLADTHPHPPEEPPHHAAPRPSEPATELKQALAVLGLRADGVGADGPNELWLWPENRPAWDLWCTVQTQWRVGMAGATGLDYAGVQAAMALQGTARGQRAELFALLRAMEAEMLAEWARSSERERRR